MYRLCDHAWLIFVDFLLHGARKVLKITTLMFLGARNVKNALKCMLENQQKSYSKIN